MSTFKPAVILSILKNVNTQGDDRKAFENTWNVNVNTLKGHGQPVPPSRQCANGSLLRACKQVKNRVNGWKKLRKAHTGTSSDSQLS
jgi:hypothetical protein